MPIYIFCFFMIFYDERSRGVGQGLERRSLKLCYTKQFSLTLICDSGQLQWGNAKLELSVNARLGACVWAAQDS